MLHKYFGKEAPVTEQASSGGQWCNSALAKMPHLGPHTDMNMDVCFPWERDRKAWCHQEWVLFWGPEESPKAPTFIWSCFPGASLARSTGVHIPMNWGPLTGQGMPAAPPGNKQVLTGSHTLLSQALGHCSGAKNIQSPQWGNHTH